MPDTHHPYSPSTLQRLSLCPGSYRMSDGLPEQKTEHAEEGTMLHKVLSEDLPNDGLTEEQTELIEQCDAFWTKLVQPEDLVCLKEKPLKVMDGENVLTEGTADVVIVHANNTADVIDWKFGRNPAPEANQNYQLAAYALGVFQEYGVSEVTAHIFQPRIFAHTSYTFQKPEAILHNIRVIIERAKNDKELVLCASDEACRYCRAASTCPACNARYGLVPADVQANMLDDPAKLLTLWERSQMALKLVDAIKAAVLDYINEHGSLGEWTLKQRSGKLEIPNASLVYDRVKSMMTGRELSECYTVKVTALLDKLAEAIIRTHEAETGEILTKKEAKRQAEKLLDDLIVRGKGSAVLTKGARK